jgi:hypothetical protein
VRFEASERSGKDAKQEKRNEQVKGNALFGCSIIEKPHLPIERCVEAKARSALAIDTEKVAQIQRL